MWRRINLDVGEAVRIGGVLVTLEYKSGRRASLMVTTDNQLVIEHVKTAANPRDENEKTIPMVDNAFVVR